MILKFILGCILSLFFFSCALKKNIIYLQGTDKINSEQVNYNVKLQKDDFLSISIFGVDENTSKLFNVPQISTSLNKGYSNGTASVQGYLIDYKGEIDFPIIGKIKFEGLYRSQAIDSLKLKLKDYIKNPVINIQIQNFKITVLGEVRAPGTFNIPNERITILEAIGLAGDLSINAVRKNIKVIRDESGIKKEYTIDLTSKSVLSSPVYYLNQNDVIYVEPNQAKVNSSNVTSSAGIFISIASLLITTLNAITK
jgi:polysaccharide export outer membrane protein